MRNCFTICFTNYGSFFSDNAITYPKAKSRIHVEDKHYNETFRLNFLLSFGNIGGQTKQWIEICPFYLTSKIADLLLIEKVDLMYIEI